MFDAHVQGVAFHLGGASLVSCVEDFNHVANVYIPLKVVLAENLQPVVGKGVNHN